LLLRCSESYFPDVCSFMSHLPAVLRVHSELTENSSQMRREFLT
jgi:hypothetical protein